MSTVLITTSECFRAKRLVFSLNPIVLHGSSRKCKDKEKSHFAQKFSILDNRFCVQKVMQTWHFCKVNCTSSRTSFKRVLVICSLKCIPHLKPVKTGLHCILLMELCQHVNLYKPLKIYVFERLNGEL